MSTTVECPKAKKKPAIAERLFRVVSLTTARVGTRPGGCNLLERRRLTRQGGLVLQGGVTSAFRDSDSTKCV